MPDPLTLAAPGVRELAPYQPGKPLAELAREYGITDAVKLASNENPLGPSPAAKAAAAACLDQLGRYPDGNGYELKAALAAHLDVAPECLTLGNGSNDVLELVARAFLVPGDEAVMSQHAFAIYALVTRAAGARPVSVPARDFGHDPEALLAAVGTRTRLVFIANPNNPTGTWLDGPALHGLLAALPEHVLAVVDEAYFEYAAHPEGGVAGYPDALAWLDELPNLIVTRTFSKAHGLAGLRVGYAVSRPRVADLLNRVRQPFNVNGPAQAAAVAALGDPDHIGRSVRLTTAERARLEAGLGALGLEVIPSAANFVAVRVGDAALPVYEGLLRRGVIVRPVENYGLPGFIRVSVGTAAENRRFLAALAEVLA